METLWIILSVLSLPATLILSSVLWWAFREARAIGAILHNRELLLRLVTLDVLKAPFGEAARYDSPAAGSYASTMRVFRQAHETGHAQAKAKVRSVLFGVIVGSGVVGCLAIGPFGLVLPIVNFLVVYVMWGKAKYGSIDDGASARAAEYVRIVALLLGRWHDEAPMESEDWALREPGMQLLWRHLVDLHGWKRRASETPTFEQGRSSEPGAGDSTTDENDSASEDRVARRVREIQERCRFPLSGTEENALREELSSLRQVLDARAAGREGKMEEVRVGMEKELRELDTSGTGQIVLPTFREWLALPANGTLEGAAAHEGYLDELKKRYDEGRAVIWFNEEKRRVYEGRTGKHDDSVAQAMNDLAVICVFPLTPLCKSLTDSRSETVNQEELALDSDVYDLLTSEHFVICREATSYFAARMLLRVTTSMSRSERENRIADLAGNVGKYLNHMMTKKGFDQTHIDAQLDPDMDYSIDRTMEYLRAGSDIVQVRRMFLASLGSMPGLSRLSPIIPRLVKTLDHAFDQWAEDNPCVFHSRLSAPGD